MQITVALDGEKKRDIRFFAGDDMSLTVVIYAHDGDLSPIVVTNVRFAAADGDLPMGVDFVVPSNFIGRVPYRIVGEVDGVTTTLVYGVMQTDGGWPSVYCWGWCGPGWGIVGKAENITVLDAGNFFQHPVNVEDALQDLAGRRESLTFRARKSATQSIASAAVNAQITFNTEDWDTRTAYDAGTGRFTPTIAGYYQVSAAAAATPAAGTIISWRVSILKNGTLELPGSYSALTGQTAASSVANGVVLLNGSGDYLTVGGSPVTSGAAAVNVQTGQETYFTASLVVPL